MSFCFPFVSSLGHERNPIRTANGPCQKFPRTLGHLWRGNWGDLTAQMRKLDPGFKGFKYDPNLPDAGYYDPKSKTIFFNRQPHQVEKGLLAEEVRHFLDDVEFGLDDADSVFRAWLKDQKLPDTASNWTDSNVRKANKWHHRRVFTRMLKNAEKQDSAVMNMILGTGDVAGVLEAYRSANVRGQLTITKLIDLIDQGLVEPY